MPVTIILHPNDPPKAKSFHPDSFSTDADTLLKRACKEYGDNDTLKRSFFKNKDLSNVCASHNGLIAAVLHAYSHHQHLVLSPQVVWNAIWPQIVFSMSEDRQIEPEHLVCARIFDADESALLDIVAKTPETDLGTNPRPLIPRDHQQTLQSECMSIDWETTSNVDRLIASAYARTGKQEYKNGGPIDTNVNLLPDTGIPSVTLEGTTADWAQLYGKITGFLRAVRPPAMVNDFDMAVLRIFQNLWQTSIEGMNKDPNLIVFWDHICGLVPGATESDPCDLLGWITIFYCYRPDSSQNFQDCAASVHGQKYLSMLSDQIAPSYLLYRLKIEAHEDDKIDTTHVIVGAGNIGVQFSSSRGDSSLDRVEVVAGWWCFTRDDNAQDL